MPTPATAPATCTQPGCTARHRARGLCSTHYNQHHQPARHAAKATACTVCGTPIQRPTKGDRRHVCSVTCRTQLQHGPGAGTRHRYSWARTAALRARAAGATVVQLYDRLDVFLRDDWTCYLCGQPTDPGASPFAPSSPTVDHVVPLSKGGEHTMRNSRTAHLSCNSAKHADLIMPHAHCP